MSAASPPPFECSCSYQEVSEYRKPERHMNLHDCGLSGRPANRESHTLEVSVDAGHCRSSGIALNLVSRMREAHVLRFGYEQ